MTEATKEQARGGTEDTVESVDGVAVDETRVAIHGMTEEGESLSLSDVGTEQHGAKKHSHGGGVGVSDSSRAGRLNSYQLADFPALTGREEDWRFTPLKRLRGLHSSALDGKAPTVTVTGPEQIITETVGRDDARIGSAGIPEDRVSASAWESFSEATVITIPTEFETNDEVMVKITGNGLDPAASHLVIHAERFSKSIVVLDHQGTATVSENVEIKVDDGAQLTVVTVQDWNDDTVHASSQQASVGQDAFLRHAVVSLGGNLVRITPSARFTGRGGEVDMLGLYFADAGQHLEQRLFVDHSEPNCKSRVTYKGALQGADAHSVWIGDVLIRSGADGTDTYEWNRNLLLTSGARADSVPNLEIETGLIEGAGHASTTGRFDNEQLFYLMARGIEEDVARRLVVRGFLNEVIQQIKVPALEERLIGAVERELAAGNN